MTDQPPPFQADNYRDALGRFGPGNAGKPLGAKSKNRIGRSALAAVQDISSLAIFKLRALVDAGEFQAIKLVIDLTVPRGRLIELDTGDPMAWADAMAEGDISPTEAATAASALVKLHEVGEIAELAKRIAELELLITEERNRR